VKRKSNRTAFVGGALLGLALITKLPAILVFGALAAWEIWRTHGFAWLKKRRVWLFVGGFAAFGLPWHLVQLIFNGSAYLGAQAGIGSSFMAPDSVFWQYTFARELSWMHWPPFWLFVLGALVYVAWKRESGDKLAIAFIAVNLLFYVFYHFHTYYLLPIAPFTALAAARAIDAIRERIPALGWATFGVFVACLSLGAVVTLAGNKIGSFSPAEIEPALGVEADGADLWADWSIWANMGPAVDMYVPNMTVQKLPQGTYEPTFEQLATGKRSFLLTPYIAQDPQTGAALPGLVQFEEHPNEVVLFGVSVFQIPQNRHLMANGPWQVKWGAYPFFTFGLKPSATPQPGPLIYDLDVLFGTGTP
jgi:4-amino-4-deoxy-L-arabinose transferase-like glycosyltransferase